jgi:pilus assembly protein CpaC
MTGAMTTGCVRDRFSGWLTTLVLMVGLASSGAAQGETDIVLIAGQSMIVQAPWPVAGGTVAVTDPTVANVQILTPDQILVQGLKAGATDLILQNEERQRTSQRRVLVRIDLATVDKAITRLFPGAELTVSESRDILVIQGLLRRADQVAQLKDFLEKTKIPYVNMTSLSGVQQVQLHVRLAEVSKEATRALGINWFITGSDGFFGQRMNGIEPSINIGASGNQDVTNTLSFTPAENGIGATNPIVNVFAGFPGQNLELFFQALAENQYMRILANPTLVALSGEEAHFLAGGEFPVPVVQSTNGGGTGNVAITIEYKQFGVLLTFRPTVLGDGRIRLRAAQEFSQLNFANGVTVQGTTVPALTSRRAEATVELGSGQSFAMAGLIQNTDNVVTSRVPGIGDLPILGPLFRSVRYQNNETELVILVTASLVEPMSTAQAPPLPGSLYAAPNDWELYVEGRMEGKRPARLDPAGRQWLQEMGLDKLVGPGAWDTYEEQDFNAAMRSAETAGENNRAAQAAVADKVEASQMPAHQTKPNATDVSSNQP